MLYEGRKLTGTCTTLNAGRHDAQVNYCSANRKNPIFHTALGIYNENDIADECSSLKYSWSRSRARNGNHLDGRGDGVNCGGKRDPSPSEAVAAVGRYIFFTPCRQAIAIVKHLRSALQYPPPPSYQTIRQRPQHEQITQPPLPTQKLATRRYHSKPPVSRYVRVTPRKFVRSQ